MTIDEYFAAHKTVHDFQDGETVYLFVDGTGDVTTKLRRDSYFGPGYLFDDKGNCYGTLDWWLNPTGGCNGISAPPDCEDYPI